MFPCSAWDEAAPRTAAHSSGPGRAPASLLASLGFLGDPHPQPQGCAFKGILHSEGVTYNESPLPQSFSMSKPVGFTDTSRPVHTGFPFMISPKLLLPKAPTSFFAWLYPCLDSPFHSSFLIIPTPHSSGCLRIQKENQAVQTGHSGKLMSGKRP